MGSSTHTVLLSILIVGAVLYCSVTAHNGHGHDDCCFKFYLKRVNIRRLRSYYMTDRRCPKPGVIVVTEKSHHLCMDPYLPWVQNMMRSLDERHLLPSG